MRVYQGDGDDPEGALSGDGQLSSLELSVTQVYEP